MEIKMVILMFAALQWLRGTIEVHDEMDEMKQEQESMKLVPKVWIKFEFVFIPSISLIFNWISGNSEGDVGEQLAEEAVDHRDDDDARPAALRDQLRHLLLHLHLWEGRPRWVYLSVYNSFRTCSLDSSQSQSATLGMGAMNVAMTFVSLALIGEMNHRLGHTDYHVIIFPHQRKLDGKFWWFPASASCSAWPYFSSPVSLLLWVFKKT